MLLVYSNIIYSCIALLVSTRNEITVACLIVWDSNEYDIVAKYIYIVCELEPMINYVFFQGANS
jgi:hypothetical protein